MRPDILCVCGDTFGDGGQLERLKVTYSQMSIHTAAYLSQEKKSSRQALNPAVGKRTALL